MGLLLSAILGGLVALVLFKLLGGSGGGSPAPDAPRPQSRYTTVYLFPTGDAASPVRVSASPEVLYVRQGDRVEWTVVDATGRGGAISFRIKQGEDPFDPFEDDPQGPTTSAADKRSAQQQEGAFTRVRTGRVRADARLVPSVRYSILVNGVELFDPEIKMEGG